MKTNPIRQFLLLQLPKPHTPEQLLYLRNWAASHPNHLAGLVQVFLSDPNGLALRAVRVLSDIPDVHPALLEPYLERLINTLSQNPHVAVRRNLMRMLQKATLPEKLQGPIARHCFTYIQDPKEPIAVRAFAITALARICQLQPDLIREFDLVLTSVSVNASAGVGVRIRDARKTLGISSTKGYADF